MISHRFSRRNNLKRSLNTRAMTDQHKACANDDAMDTCSIGSGSTASITETEDMSCSAEYSPQPPSSRLRLGSIPRSSFSQKSEPQQRSNKRLKSVGFDEQSNQYHEPQLSCYRTDYESRLCWYSEDEIQLMRSQSTAAATLLFGSNNNSQNTTSRRNRFRQRLRQQRALHRTPGCAGAAPPTAAPSVPPPTASADPSTSAPAQPRDNAELAALSLSTKRGLAVAYKESNRIRSEQDFEAGTSPVTRPEALTAVYQQVDAAAAAAGANNDGDDLCLVGLEIYILFGLRGESGAQTRYILEAVRQRTVNCPERRDEYMRLVSQYISLPSRVFVRELAHAQAQALRAEEEGQL